MSLLGRLLCKWKGHVWGRAFDSPVYAALGDEKPCRFERGKRCDRCGEYALVKRRKPKGE